jgi:hypothetical protein
MKSTKVKKNLKGPELCAKLGWIASCEDAFPHLAKNHPKNLRDWALSRELTTPDLTYAAEYLGHASDPSLALSALEQLVTHEDDLVREGLS